MQSTVRNLLGNGLVTDNAATDSGTLTFWLLHAALPAVFSVMLYQWAEHSTLDLQITQWIYLSADHHFIDNWFLTNVMHEGARSLGYVMAYSLLLALVASVLMPRFKSARLPLLFIVLSVAAGSTAVVELKHLTNVYCPSSLTLFGGERPLHSALDISTWFTLNNGQCWPGGHSSYGFSLWPLYFIAREFCSALASRIFAAVFVYGNILGTVRVVQGEHFLSHQWWTALVCWFISLSLYVLLLRRDMLGVGRPKLQNNQLLSSEI